MGLGGIPQGRVAGELRGRPILIRRDAECGLRQRDSGRPTGSVSVDSGDSARPVFTIHEDVAWDRLTFDAELSALMASASAVPYHSAAEAVYKAKGLR